MAVEGDPGAKPTCSSSRWFNLQAAKFLGDVEDPIPKKDPNHQDARTACRFIFIIFLIVGFSLALLYYYRGSPDVTVEQVHNLQPGEENYEIPIRELYDVSAKSNMTWRNPITCPCSTISVKWRDFVRFYILHSNSTAWHVSFINPETPGVVSPDIIVPWLYGDNTTLLSDHIVKDPNPITAERFCSVSDMWPSPNPSIASEITNIYELCVWMASSVFPNSAKYEDITRSATILETPSLLNREIFNMRVAGLAKDSVLKRIQSMDKSNQNSVTLQQYSNGLSDLLTGLLDRDLSDYLEWQSYFGGAFDLQQILRNHVYFRWANPMVFVNQDAEGPIFLHPEIDWMAYYKTCAPKYCEITKALGPYRQVYRAVGLVGGISSVVLGVVSSCAFPTAAKFLAYLSKRRSADK